MINTFRELRRKATRLSDLLKDKPDVLTPQVDDHLAGQAVARALVHHQPFLASRIGWTEATCIGLYLKGQRRPDPALQERIWKFSGVYPASDDQFAQFTDTYLTSIGDVDLMGLLASPFEKQLITEYGKDPIICGLSAFEPYFHPEPWSQYLAGLRVLVVHPFTESIRRQYDTVRERIFVNPKVLPSFELKLVRAPQTIAGNPGDLPSWTASLERMKSEVAAMDFDTAIVGCGAYGLPIGSFIKGLGKSCIHIGGATQLLFGITGARWRAQPIFRALETSAWRSPLESERPANWQKIEDGCYW